MIYCDQPRRYSKRGKRWSHVFSPDTKALKAFAKANNLKRRDTKPFLHYDVTEDELASLRGVTLVSRKEYKEILNKEMK